MSWYNKKLVESAQKVSIAARAIAYGAKLNFFGLALTGKDIIEREKQLTIEQEDELTSLANTLPAIYYDITNHLEQAVKVDDFRIVCFVDDLDRCLPEKAVELLESIKLFLDIPGYLFIIGVAREVIAKGIAYRYRHLNQWEDNAFTKHAKTIKADDYLDKMIQMPLEIPPIETGKK